MSSINISPVIDDEPDGANSDSSGSDGGNVIDPANIEPPKRGRGRPPGGGGNRGSNRKPGGSRTGSGSGSTARQRPASGSPALNVDGLAFFLGLASSLVAGKLKQEALALDDGEKRAIAEAAANVAAQYEVVLDPKAAAWMGLAMTAGGIYGAKFVALKVNKSLAG